MSQRGAAPLAIAAIGGSVLGGMVLASAMLGLDPGWLAAGMALAGAVLIGVAGRRRGEGGPAKGLSTGTRETEHLLSKTAELQRSNIDLQKEIHTRNRLEEELRSKEAQYRGIFESVASGLVIIDPKGKIVEANPAFCEMHGYSYDELIGRPARELVTKESLGHQHSFRQAVLRGERYYCEARHLRKDGSIFAIDAVGIPFEHRGEIHGMGIIMDITERKRTEKRLLRAQKMEALGQLAGGVAHDFNNLLFAMIGHLELLLKFDGKDARRHAAQALAAAQRAADITRQLLAVSRQQVSRHRVVDLNTVINDSRELLTRLLGEDIDFAVEVLSSPAWIRVDRGQVVQMLMNLASNARDAMPNGGRMAIAVSLHQGKRPRVRLQVSDDGTGMDNATRERIFDPFFTTKEVGKGTGMGLATVYGITEQNEGKINVWSEPDRGTRFEIEFPMVGPPTETADEPPEEEEEDLAGGQTILAVEDDEAVRELILEVLSLHGYQVIAACDGQQALALSRAHEGPIDLVLTDVVMPGMNGKQLADALCKERPDLRVLYSTGYVGDELVRRGISEQEVLEKPYMGDTLIAKVQEALRGEVAPGVP